MTEIKDTTVYRNHLFDNVKAVMLFLVAFGHVINVYMHDGIVEYTLIKYIYLFHMPLFAFVTGFFSKDAEKARNTALIKTLFPYLLFQGLYIIVAKVMILLKLVNFNTDVFNGSLILPSSAFFYLLAVFFWKVFQKDLFRFRHPLMLSILLGVTISLTQQDQFHIAYGAVFSLLVFFVLGVKCEERHIRRLRSMPKWIGICILILGIFIAYLTPYGIHSIRFTYRGAGFTNLAGIGWRMLFYMVATIMGAAILLVMPSKKTFISRIGEASLFVYAGSTVLSPHAYVIISHLLGIRSNRLLNLIGMVLFSGLLVWCCSASVFKKIYKWIIDKICLLLLQ